MGKKRSNEQRQAKNDAGLLNWATDLARKVRAQAPSTENSLTTKEERIAKRSAKRQRREENKVEHIKKSASLATGSTNTNDDGMDVPSKDGVKRAPRRRLHLLAEQVQQHTARVKEYSLTKSKWPKPYSPVPIVPKRRKRQRDDSHQPRPSDYGGIGLARESLKISFDDPSWQPKLEEEFAEHISGFFGKQRTKAMKKQLDGNMLWRQLLSAKQKGTKPIAAHKRHTIKGKDLSRMSPDERVEAMLQARVL